MARSSDAMPSGRSLPKPQTWRIENASAAAFIARSAWLMPSTLPEVTIARAPVRLSATVSSACRQSSGNSAPTSPARCAASTVRMNSMVFGSCTAMTELLGRPASMKCAASAVIARSASAKLRRFAGWPVTRGLSSGSTSAKASGLRARIRLNRTSSVGDVLVWITGSLRLSSLRSRVRPLPPGFREIPRQGGGLWPFYPIPAGDPLLLRIKQRDSVEARDQGTVERANRRDESRTLARLQERRDHGVDRRILGAHIVARALDVRGAAAPIEILLVTRRQRLIPAIPDHVEIIT